jgi:heme oxygenase (biliverdin-IX-beta and delta-forming)
MSVDANASRNLRFHLRAETQGQHEALDSSFAALLPVPDIAAYTHFLRMNQAAHGGVEAWLATTPLAQWLPEWPEWSRLSDLEADMDVMGLAPVSMPPFALAESGLPEAVGVAYVLEGSRLGAVFIHRAFEKVGALTRLPGASFRYLARSGEDKRFSRLAARMDDLAFTKEETERCVGAARSAFDYFMKARDDAASSADRVMVPV